ncbi:MAG TPA: GTP-binding protein [Thermoplasmata archaeon]|nr:GTP-binding protein [Thermoplasmata archaeon]
MPSIEQQIREIEDEIRRTQYNKATQHHIGRLKAKLARLRREAERRSGTGAARGFAVRRSGHATVSLVGFPSAGKSTLLNQLTGANSEVGDYAFTTLTVVPGLMEHKGARIQVLDLPGLIEGASKGRGMGREVIAAARSSDLILLMVDVLNPAVHVLDRELRNSGIRLNERPPDITLKVRDRGGIDIATTVDLTHIDEGLAAEMIREYGHANADVVIREDVTQDQLVDFLAGNRVYPKGFVLLNKIDLVGSHRVAKVVQELDPWHVVELSAKEGTGVDRLREEIYEWLDFIRVYMKPQGRPADINEPLVLKSGATIGDVCDALHRDFRRRFRYAQIWGESAKFPGQTVGLEHRLLDADIVTLIIHRT